MVIDRIYITGIITTILGIVSVIVSYFTLLPTRDLELARKIDSALNLLPTCRFDMEKEKRLGELLLLAKKKLDVDGSYTEASNLFSSISNDMWACKPTLAANATWMLFTVLGLVAVFGIIIIIRHYKETHKQETSNS